MAKLTEKTFATAVTLNSLIHIVNTGDTSQSAFGSSYKASLDQLVPLFGSNTDVTVTGGTYNSSTGEITFYNSTGGTFNVSGFVTGFTDSFVSGGTYSSGTATFTNTTGGTFNVTGFYTGSSEFYVSDGSLTSNRIVDMNGFALALSGGSSATFFGLIGTGDKNLQWSQTGPLNWDLINNAATNNLHIDRYSSGGGYLDTPLFFEFSSGNVGIGTTTPSERLDVNGNAYFNTTGVTTSTTPSYRFLDGTSTPTDTTRIKSIYKEFRPTTTTSSTVVGDGTLLYPNITSASSAEFYASANLTLFTNNLSNLSNNEALTGEVNVISIYSTGGTYNGIVKSSSAVLENAILGGTIDKYVGFWANGLSSDITHNGTTNKIYGFYMDNQGAGRSGNVPSVNNRYGVYIEDGGRNYFAGTVGIGTDAPSETLDVSGKTKTTNFQMTSGATSGYILTSDASGNASWQIQGGYQYYSATTITSAQTLSIGSTPVEILPAPGVGKYYDFKVYFEYIYGTTPYTITGFLQLNDSTTKRVTNQFDVNGQMADRAFVSDINIQNQFLPLNSKLEFSTSNGADPTLGDGSFKVKIFYNIVDFG